VYDQTDQVSGCVSDDMALAAFDHLASIEASRSAAFRRLDRLAVDYAGGWAGLTPGLLAGSHDQGMVDDLPPRLLHPPIKIALHGRIGRKVSRQLPPLATGRCDVEHRIDHATQIGGSRTAKPPVPGHERLYQLPLAIRQVTCVA